MKSYSDRLAMGIVCLGILACGDDPKPSAPRIESERPEDGSRPPSGQTPGSGGSAGSSGSAGGGGSRGTADYCEPQFGWPGNQVAFEVQLLEQINQRRSTGADCGMAGVFGPAVLLESNPQLTCAARIHALDMAAKGHQNQLDSKGVGPAGRAQQAGYGSTDVTQSLRAGSVSAAQVVSAWLTNQNNCKNMLDPAARVAGIGYTSASDGTGYWVFVGGKLSVSRAPRFHNGG